MKLNKDTRHLVKIGTNLIQDGMELLVTNIIELPRGKQVTARIVSNQNPIWNGRIIYAQPMSWYYGMEIR